MAELRDVRTTAAPAEVIDRLETAARRGRMPGFARDGAGFRIRVFAEAFERELIATVTPESGGSVVRLRLRLMPMMPLIYAVSAVVTVWPGVWLTESMLHTYYPPAQEWWPVAWWYLPLTVLPLPWAARSMWRKSQATAQAEIRKTMEAVERELA